MLPAAREGDAHFCPSHGGGPIKGPCFPRVLIGGKPAARLGDAASCDGPEDTISSGAPLVMIGGQPAARRGDRTLHGGLVVEGVATVLIGDPPRGASGEV